MGKNKENQEWKVGGQSMAHYKSKKKGERKINVNIGKDMETKNRSIKIRKGDKKK